jgi:hypothetical protein
VRKSSILEIGGFRDAKDLRFGMGMGSMPVGAPDRRDRLWLINAFAVVGGSGSSGVSGGENPRINGA